MMPIGQDSISALLRRGLLGLAGLTVLGVMVDLYAEEHWTKRSQLIAWAALVLAALAIALVAWRPSATRVRVAQVLAVIVVASAVVGIWEHMRANHAAGPLDFRYARTWEGMSSISRWWLAARMKVGPSPPLAPGALAQAALCVLLATMRHPALRRVEQRRAPILSRLRYRSPEESLSPAGLFRTSNASRPDGEYDVSAE